MDLAPILIAAASSDPETMRVASSQLEELSLSYPYFLSQLTKQVLSSSSKDTVLPPQAELLGLVYLKNLVSDSTQWSRFDQSQQEFLLQSLIHYLKQHPSPSQFIAEILGRVFRHEWSRGVWPTGLWTSMIQSRSWLPFRRCVQRAAALRLPARRRVLAEQISSLFPQMVFCWVKSERSNELLRTIYTCITVLDPPSAAKMLSEHCESTEALVTSVLQSLTSSSTISGDSKRFAKLLHAILFLIPQELRSSCALVTLKHMLNYLGDACTDRKTALWCLALIFNLLSAAFRQEGDGDSGHKTNCTLARFPSILPETRSSIASWLSDHNSKASQYTNAVYLLLVLMRNWMALLPCEIKALHDDPESCFSNGGAQCTDEGGNTQVFLAEDFWTLEPTKRSADCIPVGSDNPINLRQLADSTFILVSRHCSSTLEMVLPSAIEELMLGEEAHLKEVALRCAQFLLEISPTNWCTRIDALLASTTNLPLDPLILGRRMTLLVRRGLIGSCSSDVGLENCLAVLSQLISYLNIQCSPKSCCIAIHLTSGSCLRWLFENPSFPPEVISKAPGPTLEQMLTALADLAKEVEEVETQLLVLEYLQSAFNNADMEGQFNCFINALERLWRIVEGNTSLRAGLIDLVATVMRALTLDTSSILASTAASQLINLAVTSLLIPDLSRFLRVGNLSRTDDEDAMEEEVIADACLRLWHALVTGRGAVWSSTLETLMPLLTDGNRNCDGLTLYGKLETMDQAQLFFEIANGCLRITASLDFLSTWTEPFWRPILREIITNNAMRADIVASKFIDSAIDVPVEERSDLLLEQLKLLTAWGSQLFRLNVPLSPSICGLLILHSVVCLLKAPVEVHDDPAFKSNQLRLLLLAQLAATPGKSDFLLALLTSVAASGSATYNLEQECFNLSTGGKSAPTCDANSCQNTLQALLVRLLAHADSLSNRLHRRCFALAAVFCLRHISQFDSLCNEHLEPVISLCVQVLYESDDVTSNGHGESAWVPPTTVIPALQLKASLQCLLGNAGDLPTSQVDPALLAQLSQMLT